MTPPVKKGATPLVHSESVPSADGWIKHDGKGMPVAGRTRVLVRFRAGYTETEADLTSPAEFWDWVHYGTSGDIIAYRIVSAEE